MNAAGQAGNTRWRFFALLAAMAFLSYALRQDIQVAGQFMMPALGISEVQMGWIYAAFPLGYAVAQLPGGMLGERFGPRRVLTVLGVLWLFTSVATGILPDLFAGSVAAVIGVLLAVRFLVGIVHAPIFPVQAIAIANWFPVGHWGLPTSLSSAGLTLGAAATQPLVAAAMVAWGWQSAFYIYIPFGLLLFMLWWRYATDDPAHHRAVGRADQMIRANRRDTLLLAIAYFSMNVVFYLFFTWFLHYLVKVRGFSLLGEGSWLAALPWLTGTFAAVLGGWSCDRLCGRFGPRLGCRIPGACGMAATAVFPARGFARRQCLSCCRAVVIVFCVNTVHRSGVLGGADLYRAGACRSRDRDHEYRCQYRRYHCQSAGAVARGDAGLGLGTRACRCRGLRVAERAAVLVRACR